MNSILSQAKGDIVRNHRLVSKIAAVFFVKVQINMQMYWCVFSSCIAFLDQIENCFGFVICSINIPNFKV